ncbi:putative EamA domain-containing protein [Helianthus anomalus]
MANVPKPQGRKWQFTLYFFCFRICLFQVLSYQGIYYSSPTMASAISNLSPGNTFLFAVAFR